MRHRILDALVWLGIFLTGGVLAAALAFPAWAQETKVGRGIICDTAEQVEMFAALSVSDGADKALAFVNETVGTNACGVVPVAFIEGPEAKTITIGDKSARIVEIVIIAVNLGMGWQPVPPMKQFTLFVIEGRPA